ncbi:hypothetical protein MASR2M48_31500 [Spirochaetota bacterium]
MVTLGLFLVTGAFAQAPLPSLRSLRRRIRGGGGGIRGGIDFSPPVEPTPLLSQAAGVDGAAAPHTLEGLLGMAASEEPPA